MQAAHQPAHLRHQAQVGNFDMNMVVAGFPLQCPLQPHGLAFVPDHQGQQGAQFREPAGGCQAYTRVRAGEHHMLARHGAAHGEPVFAGPLVAEAGELGNRGQQQLFSPPRGAGLLRGGKVVVQRALEPLNRCVAHALKPGAEVIGEQRQGLFEVEQGPVVYAGAGGCLGQVYFIVHREEAVAAMQGDDASLLVHAGQRVLQVYAAQGVPADDLEARAGTHRSGSELAGAAGGAVPLPGVAKIGDIAEGLGQGPVHVDFLVQGDHFELEFSPLLGCIRAGRRVGSPGHPFLRVVDMAGHRQQG